MASGLVSVMLSQLFRSYAAFTAAAFAARPVLVEDVLLVSLVMGGEADEDTRVRADVNLDGEISVADVTALVAIVMAQ